jgi:hypothetical protein
MGVGGQGMGDKNGVALSPAQSPVAFIGKHYQPKLFADSRNSFSGGSAKVKYQVLTYPV